MYLGGKLGKVLWIVPGLSATLAGIALQLTSSWELTRVFWLDPERSFEDLWQVTSNADCAALDPHWAAAGPTCDPWGRPYNYPSVWVRIFAHLGLRASDTDRIGIVMILVFGGTVVALSLLTVRGARPAPLLVLTLSALSPPALMAMERGNVDLLVWPWMVLWLWLMASDRWTAAAPVLGTAVFLKIFPLGLLAAGFARRRGRLLFFTVTVLTCAVALVSEAGQLALIRRTTPQNPVQSWGVSVLPAAREASEKFSAAPYFVGLIVFALGVAVGLLGLRVSGRGRVTSVLERMRTEVSRDRVSEVVVSAGLGIVVFTYLLGTNFDYRMTVVTVLIAGLVRCWADLACRVGALVLVGLQFASYPLGYPRELIGDVVWAGVAPALATVACWLWLPSVRHWVERRSTDDIGQRDAEPTRRSGSRGQGPRTTPVGASPRHDLDAVEVGGTESCDHHTGLEVH